MTEEIFDIVDEKGQPVGGTVTRSKAHAQGIPHRTAHIWVVRENGERTEVLLQKRALNKDSFPGRYDTSSAGHIQAGDEPLESAIRELAEELGIQVKPDELHFAGTFPIQYEKEFHGKMFKDNEIAFVYVYNKKVDIDNLTIQKEELDSVEWFDLEEVYEACQPPRNEKFCVPMGGLEIVRKYVKKSKSCMTKAVIFDMFETLVSMFSGDTYFSEDMAEDLKIQVDTFRNAWRSTEYDRSCGNYTMEEGIKTTLEMLGEYSEESAKLLADKRRKTLEGIFERTPVETISLLQELKRRGIKIGLISNCFSDEAEVIRKSSIFSYLDVAILSYEQGTCKPDHALYIKAMEKLGVTAEECLYVGDGGSRELFAARELGMKCIQARYFADMAFEPHIPCGELDGFEHAYAQDDILRAIEGE